MRQARKSLFHNGRLDHIDEDKLDDPEHWRQIPILTKEDLRGLTDNEFYQSTFEVTPDIVVLETGTLAQEFESSVKAPRFVDSR